MGKNCLHMLIIFTEVIYSEVAQSIIHKKVFCCLLLQRDGINTQAKAMLLNF